MVGTSEPHRVVPVVRARQRFDVFYGEELGGVVALCLAVSRRPWVAEELAQEAFLRAYRRWDVVGGYDRPDAWGRRVALNVSTSWGRRLQAESRALVRSGFRPSNLVSDPVPDEEFWEALRALPRRQAQVLGIQETFFAPLTNDERALVAEHLRRRLVHSLGLAEDTQALL